MNNYYLKTFSELTEEQKLSVWKEFKTLPMIKFISLFCKTNEDIKAVVKFITE